MTRKKVHNISAQTTSVSTLYDLSIMLCFCDNFVREIEEALPPPLITTLLRELCSKVCDKWEDIALFLHIEDGILRAFKHDYPSDSQKCFIEMLKHWLKQVDPPPTWAAIIDAIHTLGHESLASDLRQKYLYTLKVMHTIVHLCLYM